MSHSEGRDLATVEKLIHNFKYDEALKNLNDLVQLEKHNVQQKISYQLYIGKILVWQSKYEEAIKLGEQIVKENKKFNEELQSVDGLILILTGLVFTQKFDDALEIIEQTESILKKISQLSQNDLTLRKVRIAVCRGWIYYKIGEIELAQKCLKLTIDQQKELGTIPAVIQAHIIMATLMSDVKSEFNLALEYSKKAMSLAEAINNHYWIAMSHGIFGMIYGSLGEIDLSIEHSTKSLTLYKKINNKRWIASMLNNIGYMSGIKGEYDLALEYLEQSLTLFEEVDSISVDYCLDSLIYVCLEKGDIDRTQQYFQKLENIYDQRKDRIITLTYQYNKALMLKMSTRIRDIVKAEKLFKQIVEDEIFSFDITINAFIHLCDLFLKELSFTNDVEVLDELNNYLNRLLVIAEKSHSYLILCESYILQAKLALLTLDLSTAQGLLTKAQRIAENYGIKRLAMKISNEHDKLLKQLKRWENFKDSEVSLSERVKLARIDEQMEKMIRRQIAEISGFPNEDPVFLLIVSEGGIPIFSQSFEQDQSLEDHIFGGFVTAINSFITEKFSEGLDRAIFGEYTLLLNSVSPFFICYVFKGQSYSAQQKVRAFIDKIQSDKLVWQTFRKFYQLNKEIQLKDIPSLEPLIKEIFIDRTILLTK